MCLALTALAVITAACGGSPHAKLVQPSPAAVPSASPSPQGGTHLQLSGDMAATIDHATPMGICGKTPLGFTAQLQFPLQSQPYVLGITILDYHGAGTYQIPPERVSLHTMGLTNPPVLLPATAGSVVVDAGESSGQLDASLQGQSTAARITGTWACK
jgi:hypothetical protein